MLDALKEVGGLASLSPPYSVLRNVARMSEATCGTKVESPAYRFAYAGYALTSEAARQYHPVFQQAWPFSPISGLCGIGRIWL